MEIVKLDDAKPYEVDPPNALPIHHGVRALRLQGGDASNMDTFVVGLSYYLPGAGVDEHVADTEKIYLVVDGCLTVTAGGESVNLKPLDSCRLVPGEHRTVENRTNRMASMLVLVPKPGGGAAVGSALSDSIRQ